MNGQLWQECRRRGCDTEPVCVGCELCERHCTCPPPPTEEEQAQAAAAHEARRAALAAAREAFLSRLETHPESLEKILEEIPLQAQLSNGGWLNITDKKQIASLLDRVIAREPWYAPRVKREPRTSHVELLRAMAAGETLSWDDEWYANLRLRFGPPEPPGLF